MQISAMTNDNVLDAGGCLKVWLVQRLALFNDIINEPEEEFSTWHIKEIRRITQMDG